MTNTPKDTPEEVMVSVTCTQQQCGKTFSVSSSELTRVRDVTCPLCKEKFTPIFTEGTKRE
jgi:hypothetical protein